jgi:hypothetical protein
VEGLLGRGRHGLGKGNVNYSFFFDSCSSSFVLSIFACIADSTQSHEESVQQSRRATSRARENSDNLTEWQIEKMTVPDSPRQGSPPVHYLQPGRANLSMQSSRLAGDRSESRDGQRPSKVKPEPLATGEAVNPFSLARALAPSHPSSRNLPTFVAGECQHAKVEY